MTAEQCRPPDYLVYGLYDAADDLLYVGQTGDLATRLRAHAREKSWWPEVARITTTPVASKAEAIEAERDSIRSKSPRYNVQLVPGLRMIIRSVRMPEKLWNEARAKADERQESVSDVLREALERYVRSKR